MTRVAPRVSLAQNFPNLAAEWHPNRNGTLTPDDVGPSSGLKVWWRCSNDSSHEWPAVVKKTTKRGEGCPYCGGRLAPAQGPQVGTGGIDGMAAAASTLGGPRQVKHGRETNHQGHQSPNPETR